MVLILSPKMESGSLFFFFLLEFQRHPVPVLNAVSPWQTFGSYSQNFHSPKIVFFFLFVLQSFSDKGMRGIFLHSYHTGFVWQKKMKDVPPLASWSEAFKSGFQIRIFLQFLLTFGIILVYFYGFATK